MTEDERNASRTLYGFWLSPYVSLVAQVLEEAGLAYRYERVSPFTGESQSEAHLLRNPLGKVPCLREPVDTLVYESQAICRYLSRTYPEARKFYPCGDPALCAEIDTTNDFLTFSISGPFYNWFVVGAYYPQAFRLKTEEESRIFSSWSLINVKSALGRLIPGSKMSPFLLGAEPTLPDFHLFHILQAGKTLAEIFEMPLLNLLAGDEALQKFYAAMSSRPSTEEILKAQAAEYAVTKREIFEDFGDAYEEYLKSARLALKALFGRDF